MSEQVETAAPSFLRTASIVFTLGIAAIGGIYICMWIAAQVAPIANSWIGVFLMLSFLACIQHSSNIPKNQKAHVNFFLFGGILGMFYAMLFFAHGEFIF